MGAVLETGEPQDVVEACLHLIPLVRECEGRNTLLTIIKLHTLTDKHR